MDGGPAAGGLREAAAGVLSVILVALLRIYIYIYIYIYMCFFVYVCFSLLNLVLSVVVKPRTCRWWPPRGIYILQRGVQWKQGVVVYVLLYAVLLCNTTPIHCTPLPLHPPLQSIQGSAT